MFATKTAGFVRDMANAFNCENEKYHIEVEIFQRAVPLCLSALNYDDGMIGAVEIKTAG